MHIKSLEKSALYCTLFGIFCLPWSVFLSNFIILGAVIFCFTPTFRQKFASLFSLHAVRATVVLLGLILFGFLVRIHYSHTGAGALSCIRHVFLKLVFLLLLIPLFSKRRARVLACYAFMAGMLVFYGYVFFLELIRVWQHTAANVFSVLNPQPIVNVWQQHAASNAFATLNPQLLYNVWHYSVGNILATLSPQPLSVLAALSAVVALYFCLYSSKHSLLSLLYVIVALVYLFLLSIERQGQLLFIVLFLGLMWHRFHWWGMIGACLCGAVLAIIFCMVPGLGHHWIQGLYAISHPQHLAYAQQASIMQRAYTWKYVGLYSLHAPVIGFGSGSYPDAYRLAAPYVITHNFQSASSYYPMIILEWGYLGLLAFLYWYAATLYDAQKLPFSTERFVLQCLVVSALVDGFFYPTLWGHFSGLSYSVGLSVCLGGCLALRAKSLK